MRPRPRSGPGLGDRGVCERAVSQSGLRRGVVCPAEPGDEVMALMGTPWVLVHHGAEKVGKVVLVRVLGVSDELAVVVSCLQAWYWTAIKS